MLPQLLAHATGHTARRLAGGFPAFFFDGVNLVGKNGDDLSGAYALADLGNKRGAVEETGESVFYEEYSAIGSANNGGFETALSAITDWDTVENGTSTVTRITSDFDTGVACAEIQLDSSGSLAALLHSGYGNITAGEEVQWSFRAKRTAGTDNISVGTNTDGTGGTQSLTSEWATYSGTFTAINTGPFSLKRAAAGANTRILIDNVQVEILNKTVTEDVTYVNPVVRLRRDSDGLHKSFNAKEVKNGSMLAWANQDVPVLDDNFIADITGWSSVGTSAISHNVGNDTLQIDYTSGQTGGASAVAWTATDRGNGLRYLVSVTAARTAGSTSKIRVRTTNTFARTTHATTGDITNNGDASANGYTLNLTGSQVTYTMEFTLDADPGANAIYLQIDGGTASETATIEISSITVTQLTANGFCATLYDQSGVDVESNLVNDSGEADNSADYAGVDGTVSYDTDHYLLTYSAATQYAIPIGLASPFVNGEDYRFSIDVKSGTGGDVQVGFARSDGVGTPGAQTTAGMDSNVGVTTSEWQTITVDFPAIDTTTAPTYLTPAVLFYLLSGNVQFRNFKVEKIAKYEWDATQATAASQPAVVQAGVQVADSEGNDSIYFDGTDDWLQATGVAISDSSVFAAFEFSTIQTSGIYQIGTLNQVSSIVALTSGTQLQGRRSSSLDTPDVTPTVDTLYLASHIALDAQSELWIDGPSEGSETTATTLATGTVLTMGALDTSASLPLDGFLTSLLVYTADKSTDRQAIERALADLYTTNWVYIPPPLATMNSGDWINGSTPAFDTFTGASVNGFTGTAASFIGDAYINENLKGVVDGGKTIEVRFDFTTTFTGGATYLAFASGNGLGHKGALSTGVGTMSSTGGSGFTVSNNRIQLTAASGTVVVEVSSITFPFTAGVFQEWGTDSNGTFEMSNFQLTDVTP